MDKKGKSNKAIDELGEMFADGVLVDVFLDGVDRYIKPISLRNFKEFMESVTTISPENLWMNFLSDDGMDAITKMLEMSFPANDVDEIIDAINASNFEAIINSIMKANGISFNQDNIGDSEGK